MVESSKEILENSILEQRNSLTTDRLDMSYGEIMSMYENNEIIISPQFQRLFRWDIEKRTRFIESVLLGIPIPPIFVAEDKDGKWELVDGLQRISSILSFFGKLKENVQDNNWVLEEGSLIKELDGFTSESLPEKYIRNIKRTYCRVEIIKWDSKYDMRYELFNRLNTGGAPLTDQEIRNCIYRGTSERFNDLLKELTQTTGFKELISIGKVKAGQLYDEELILRFFSLFYTPFEKIEGKNISQFMSNYMKEVIEKDSFNYEEGKQFFEDTVNILKYFNNDIFKFSNNQFSTSLYDAIMVGVARNIDYYKQEKREVLLNRIEKLKLDEGFKKYVGSAASSKSRVVNRMKVALKNFNEE